MTRIIFARENALTILRYTSLNLIHAGSIWMEAWATDADLETFRLNNWAFSVEK